MLLNVRRVGDSVGIILSQEALAVLKVQEGDTLTLTEVQGGVLLTATTPDFVESTKVFESLNERYRNALRELAE